MTNLIIGIFVLGILVLIHELGHFIVAKLCKIRVLKFSIGFGPKIVSKQIGETVYQIAAIPFGGFVAMEGGEFPKEGTVLTENAFARHPLWQRALVAIAGPVFNIIFAYIFLVIVFMNGVPHAPHLDTNVVGLVAENSASYGQVERGDKIIAINGKEVDNWMQINAIFNDLSTRYSLVLLRGNDTLNAEIEIPLPDPQTLESAGSGIFAPVPPIIGHVDENGAAFSAGFLAGDSIISINGEEISSWYAVSETISRYGDFLRRSIGEIDGEAIDLQDEVAKDLQAEIEEELQDAHPEIFVGVLRNGERIDLSVVPTFNEEHERFMIGIVMANPAREIKRYPVSRALVLAFEDCIKYSRMIFSTMRKLVMRIISPQYLSGPVGIMQMSGAAAQSGFSAFLQLMAIIGINLGLLNLMPLVITDGGVLSLLLIEAIRKKPIPDAVRERLSYVVMIGFLCLAFFVTFNDIMRFSTIENLLR